MRRPADVAGWWALAAAVLLVAGLSAGGRLVTASTRSLLVTVPPGVSGHARELDVRVDGAQLAPSVVARGRPVTATGVFVLVRWTAMGATHPVAVQEPTLHTADGRSYAPRTGLGASTGTLQPGFARTFNAVFDLPADAVAGAAFVLAPKRWEVQLYDTTVRVPLGLDRSPRTPVLPVPVPEAVTMVTG